MNQVDIVAWLRTHAAGGAHLCMDSRHVAPGDVFFAVPGRTTDGRRYLLQAVERGASSLVIEADPAASHHDAQSVPPCPVPESIPVLYVSGLSRCVGHVAHEWYGRPSETVSVVAVTGTNGKTSCVQWLAAALNAESVPCGTIGTLGVTLPDGGNLGGALTTPDVLTVHRCLAALREAGAEVVAMEASSIGIEQGRLDGVRVSVAAFTNLTHDHLDYHLTLDNYRQAKMALFTRKDLGAIITNLDDPVGREIFALKSACPVTAYSLREAPDAQVKAHEIQAGRYGLVFNVSTPSGQAQLLTRLVGEHNVANLLLVAAVLEHLGWGLPKVARVLASLQPVEGRLQWVDPVPVKGVQPAAPLVVVDYAHTPDALERALVALRDLATARQGRLVCVFGCGGDRDVAKRPVMGRIASRLADDIILTSDNPRSEEPAHIMSQVLAGMPAEPVVEPDRACAILTAIWRAQPADVILLAGKGHETYQEFSSGRIPFDDREWARFALTWRQDLPVSTDTRTLESGDLFIALRGDAFDGHDYIEAARVNGACAAIVESACDDPLPQFVLGDTRQALIRAALTWRALHDLPLIAVTGSNGKTTTKEMIACILRAAHGDDATMATRGNLNNDIGVPLTLLRLRAVHKAAVVELGMNHPGEIALLAQMARPTVALVNNAQREHQEFMRSVEAVARENGTVIHALPDNGVAVFPGDDTFSDLWLTLAAGRPVLRFGFESRFDIWVDQIRADQDSTGFVLHYGSSVAELTLRAPGVHNLRNAMAAAACALAAGIELAVIARGLEAFLPVGGRMQPHRVAGGFQVIDDTYNANPDSVRAAIDVLASLKGKKILVLGDMAEVGDNGPLMHAEVGAYALEQGIDELLVLGDSSAHAARAFGPAARSFGQFDDLMAALLERLPANVLIKGSRSARMERVLKALAERSPEFMAAGD